MSVSYIQIMNYSFVTTHRIFRKAIHNCDFMHMPSESFQSIDVNITNAIIYSKLLKYMPAFK